MIESCAIVQVSDVKMHMSYLCARWRAFPGTFWHPWQLCKEQRFGRGDKFPPFIDPIFLGTVCAHLNTETIGIDEIESLALEMIRRTKSDSETSEMLNETTKILHGW
jgi:hypothetical protein